MMRESLIFDVLELDALSSLAFLKCLWFLENSRDYFDAEMRDMRNPNEIKPSDFISGERNIEVIKEFTQFICSVSH